MSIWFYGTRKRGLSTTANGGNRDSTLSKIYAVLGKTTRATTYLCYTSQNTRYYRVSVFPIRIVYPTSLLTFFSLVPGTFPSPT